MKTERLYAVHFDTQFARIYCSWEYITTAANKREAIEEARNLWNNPTILHPFLYEYERYDRLPHMFHLSADRVDDLEDRKLHRFTVISSQHVNYGRR